METTKKHPAGLLGAVVSGLHFGRGGTENDVGVIPYGISKAVWPARRRDVSARMLGQRDGPREDEACEMPWEKWVWKIGMVFRQPPFRFLTNNNTRGVLKKVDLICLREDDAPLAVGAASTFLRLVYLRRFCDRGSDEASATYGRVAWAIHRHCAA